MPSRKDDDSYSSGAMGFDPLGDDDEVLARTLYSSGNQPLTEALPKTSAAKRDVPSKKDAAKPKEKPAVQARATRKKPAQKSTRRRRREKPPQHYKVLSISLYNEDIEQMDEFVKELKKQGFTRMNRSALIRFALDQVDISKMPRGY